MGQQQELRRAAEAAFFESLEQLQQTLESNGQTPTSAQPIADASANRSAESTDVSPSVDPGVDMDSLEAVIADIEQFIEQREGNQG